MAHFVDRMTPHKLKRLQAIASALEGIAAAAELNPASAAELAAEAKKLTKDFLRLCPVDPDKWALVMPEREGGASIAKLPTSEALRRVETAERSNRRRRQKAREEQARKGEWIRELEAALAEVQQQKQQPELPT